MMFSGASAARGPREAAAQEENKTGAGPKMPVFKGKAKLNTGGATNEEVSGSRMNYDFSRMGMSAATAGKKPEGERGEGGERRQNRPQK